MTSFVAFAIDINGTALARYDLAATEEEMAEARRSTVPGAASSD
jgi:hypothetical protein